MRFRHPLVHAAAYNAAPGKDRRRVHRALSVVADSMGLDERGAWHAAKATLGTDEAVAARLEQAADTAGQRGGFASRANVLAQASALSPGDAEASSTRRRGRGGAGGRQGDVAKSLIDDVDESALDEVLAGRMISLTAQLALFTADPAVTHGAADLLEAAAYFQGATSRSSRTTLIRAWELFLPAANLAVGMTPDELGRRMATSAPSSTRGPPARSWRRCPLSCCFRTPRPCR